MPKTDSTFANDDCAMPTTVAINDETQGSAESPPTAESPASTELLAIREAIGDVDRRLVALLAERMQLAKEVAVAKRAARRARNVRAGVEVMVAPRLALVFRPAAGFVEQLNAKNSAASTQDEARKSAPA